GRRIRPYDIPSATDERPQPPTPVMMGAALEAPAPTRPGPFRVVEGARSLWAQRQLIRQFVRREVEARYRGSTLGWRWSLLNPLLLLAVYTFVFGVVFRARWP